MLALEFGCFSGEAAIARCYGARRGTGNYYQLHMRDTMAPSESCRSTDTNVLLATRNQVGRHGLYPGHYSGIFVAPRMQETQKPSVGQGLYPILLPYWTGHKNQLKDKVRRSKSFLFSCQVKCQECMGTM